MKKNHLKPVLLLCLLFYINPLLAEKPDTAKTDFDKYISVLTDMPKLFQTLLNNLDDLAKSQDKRKFYILSTDVLFNLHELKQSKVNLLVIIDQPQGIIRTSLNSQIENMKNKILDLQKTLIYNKDLLKGLNADGYDAFRLTDSLNTDFTSKQQLLNEILPQGQSPSQLSKDRAIKKIKAGIAILDSSIFEMETFSSKLRKKL